MNDLGLISLPNYLQDDRPVCDWTHEAKVFNYISARQLWSKTFCLNCKAHASDWLIDYTLYGSITVGTNNEITQGAVTHNASQTLL